MVTAVPTPRAGPNLFIRGTLANSNHMACRYPTVADHLGGLLVVRHALQVIMRRVADYRGNEVVLRQIWALFIADYVATSSV